MKKLFFYLLVLLTASACYERREREDPRPELAGTYQISTINVTVGTVTAAGSSGTVTVTRRSDTQIALALTATVQVAATGQNVVFNNQDLGTGDIREVSGGNYDILDGTERVGSINGTDLNLDIVGADPQGQLIRVRITARK